MARFEKIAKISAEEWAYARSILINEKFYDDGSSTLTYDNGRWLSVYELNKNGDIIYDEWTTRG